MKSMGNLSLSKPTLNFLSIFFKDKDTGVFLKTFIIKYYTLWTGKVSKHEVAGSIPGTFTILNLD